MVHRIYVEKRAVFAQEAASKLADIRNVLGICVLPGSHSEPVRRGRRGRHAFSSCRFTVFAEPQTDETFDALPTGADAVFAAEYLPGQFDQRAEACAQCIALLSQRGSPIVRTARVYRVYGAVNEA